MRSSGLNRLGLHPAPDLPRPGPPHHPSNCPSAGPWDNAHRPPLLCLRAPPTLPCSPVQTPCAPCPAPLLKHPGSRAACPTPSTGHLPFPVLPPRSCLAPWVSSSQVVTGPVSFSPMPHTPSGLEWGHQVSGTHRPACPRWGHCPRGAGLLVTWDSLGLGLRVLLPTSPSATPSLVCRAGPSLLPLLCFLTALPGNRRGVSREEGTTETASPPAVLWCSD